MADKRMLREKLGRLRPMLGVLPTGRVDVASAEALRGIARSLREGDTAKAEAEAGEQLLKGVRPEAVAGGVLAEMAAQETLREQLAAFSSAGIGFFRATQDFMEQALGDRRAAGGSGAVNRVLVNEKPIMVDQVEIREAQLLLETPRLVLRFANDSTEANRMTFASEHDLMILRTLDLSPGVLQLAAEDRDMVELCLELMEHELVDYAEPDFIEYIGMRHRPTDPDYGRQWHLLNTGPVAADIRAELAWDTVRGENVRLAVVDNGFDTSHPDLSFDAVSGWFRATADNDDADFVAGTSNMPAGDHGTACAGMAAANADNGVGGCGVAFGASLTAVACLGDQIGPQSTLARAIAYAADPSLERTDLTAADGADVIACSLGPNGAQWEMRQVLSDAIDAVTTTGRNGRGTPVFWAVTNGNFPISYDEVCSHPSVIAVGRSTNRDTDDGSGYGPELDFLAPGVDVFLPAQGGGHQVTTGTSFACPCAAGAGALVLSANSALDAAQVRQTLRETCDKIGPLSFQDGRNDRFGHGRINAAQAVAAASATNPGT